MIIFIVYVYIVILYAQIGEGTGDPLQYSCLENPRDREQYLDLVGRG